MTAELAPIDPPDDSRYDEPDYGDLEDDCSECGGKGWITDECDEDCCCCADPETQHALIPCPVCNPKGKR